MNNERSIVIAGVGPGSREYLLPVTRRKAREADILVGSSRALKLFAGLEAEKHELSSNLEATKNLIDRSSRQKKVMVLVTGDPGLYSLAGYLKKHFSGENLEIIPGISAMQLGLARAGLGWQDVRFVSLHGRDNLEELLELVKSRVKIGIFTDEEYSPARIGSYLIERGVDPEIQVFVAENLSYPEERTAWYKISQLEDKDFSHLNVMVIADE